MAGAPAEERDGDLAALAARSPLLPPGGALPEVPTLPPGKEDKEKSPEAVA